MEFMLTVLIFAVSDPYRLHVGLHR